MERRTFLVAGGSRGIGLEVTHQLVDRGHRVVVLSRSAPVRATPDIVHYAYDFSTNEALPELHEIFDGIVYSPGSINLKPLAGLREDEVLADFRLNVLGALRLIKGYRRNLSKAGASVVLFSSVAARTGMPFHTSVSVSKAAVEGLTVALAAELAPDVRVNCIAPSLTDTPLAAPLLSNETKRSANALRHPLRRIGSPKDIASLASFLLLDGTWISGQVLGVNGGLGSLIK